MTDRIKIWVSAIRPRTIPLSLSGVIVGGCIAASTGEANLWAWLLCAVTAVLLQILSNLANDYGDFDKGIDTSKRTGPQRAMQSGKVSAREMKRAIGIVAALALLSGASLVFLVARLSITEMIVFAALGAGAIAAAVLYTLGKRPYGYRGLGDFYCFIFFGLVSVAGTFYIVAHQWDSTVLLPAAAIGCMSNAVLNINNMRDYVNDKLKGKNSLVVRIGIEKAKKYHTFLIIMAFVCLTAFTIINGKPVWSYSFLLLPPFFIKDLLEIHALPVRHLDPYLKKQAIKTFLLAVVYGVTIL